MTPHIVRVLEDGTRRPATDADRIERLAELRAILDDPATELEAAKGACRELHRWGCRIEADEAWERLVDA